MANIVVNKLTISADEPKLDKVLKYMEPEKGGTGSIDFNKIIPMPESLNLTSGSITDDAISAHLSTLRNENLARYSIANFYAKKVGGFHRFDTSLSPAQIGDLAKRNDMSPEALIDLGKQYINNQKEHGALTWYDWSVANWGTKWNLEPSDCFLEGDTITFNTAWSAPLPIVEALSRQFPDVAFGIQWADEDLGYNVGKITFLNGEELVSYFPLEASKEAYEMAFEMFGISPEDRFLSFDEAKGTYAFDEALEEKHFQSYGDSLSVSDLTEKAKERLQENGSDKAEPSSKPKSQEPEL